MNLADYALGSAERLLRLAHQLTADPDSAVEVVVRALGRVPARRSGRTADAAVRIDERVLAEVVQIALHEGAPKASTRSDLDALTHHARVAVVLALGLGWDADGIAETMHSSARRVRSEVATAIATKDERAWRHLLEDGRWAVEPPTDLTERVRGAAGRRRSGNHHRSLGLAATLILLVGLADTLGRAATTPEPAPAAAHVPGLLDWPVRGDLDRDKRLFAAAGRLWEASSGAPAGRVHLLWAGHVGVGRLVVLQARGPGGALVAVVADHDVSFRHPALRLDAVAPLTRTDVPFLTVAYDGNLNIPGLEPGPGSRVVQLLTAPDVTRIEQRRVLTEAAFPARRPTFTAEPLDLGMSQPWLDLTGQRPATAVRVTRRSGAVGLSLLDEGLLPTTAAPVLVPAAGEWAGLPLPVDQETLRDDALWWAQDCRKPAPRITALWASTSGPAAGVRIELVDCGTDFTTLAMVRSVGSDIEWLSGGGGFAGPSVEAYGLSVSTLQTPLIVVVGSSRVRSIVIGASRITGRVAVATGRSPGHVAAMDADGHQLSMLFVGDR